MKKQDLFNTINSHQLGHHKANFESLLRPAIRLSLFRADDNDIPLGQSKIGGRPDLPAHIAWPSETVLIEKKKKGFFSFVTQSPSVELRPLGFIAQINLTEFAQFDEEAVLPSRGMLYFFYTAQQDAWGFDYKDKPKFKVIFYEGDLNALVRQPLPAQMEPLADYPPATVTSTEEISLPSAISGLYDFMSPAETDIFFDKVYNEDGNINKLLGYADTIQGDMELECELVTNGLYCGDPSGYNDPRRKILEPGARDWRLLLQVDSNDDNEMMWGDSGRLYFWIRTQDLKDKKFDRAWFILQCY